VQWGYDRINVGEGGVLTLVLMLGAWLWGWICGGTRRGEGVFVNAAAREDGSGGEEEGVVVEL
jgi:hypothetical protein